MGDNRFYYSVLLVESLEGQEKLEQHYNSAKFKPAQDKSSFDKHIPSVEVYVLPVSNWRVVREKLSNIEDDSVFDPWFLKEDNKECFLIVLEDGSYYCFVSQNPHFEQLIL